MWLLVMTFVLAVTAVDAAAQQENKVGLVVGYPTSVGVLWRLSDRVAIRPEGSISWTSSEQQSQTAPVSFPGSGVPLITYTTTTHQHSDSVSAAVGASVLVTLTSAERFRMYLVPRVAMAVTRTSDRYETRTQVVSSTLPAGGVITGLGDETRTSAWTSRAPSLSVGLGASTRAHERFELFAEIGVGYSRTRVPTIQVAQAFSHESSTHGIALRSGVGATIFF